MLARMTDGSTVKLILLDKQLLLNTPYGDLQIPVEDIQRLEFATRVTASTQRTIDAAVANLRSKEFRVREMGTAAIVKLREKAYPALLGLCEDDDAEVSSRAKQMLAKLKDTVADELLIVRGFDIVHTSHSKIAGRIDIETLKVETEAFGEQQVALYNLLSIGSKGETPKSVINDPGTLIRFQGQLGKKLYFKVTGAQPNGGLGGFRGSLYGTEKFTTDSALALAVVHAGVLKPGETGIVRVTMMGPQQSFLGSIRNGVRSSGYGQYPGAFQVRKVAK